MPPLETIRRMSRDREEQNCWQELCQPHISKVEGPLGDLVDLPSHGHSLHLDRGDDQKSGDLEKNEPGMRKGSASSPGVGGGRHELFTVPQNAEDVRALSSGFFRC